MRAGWALIWLAVFSGWGAENGSTGRCMVKGRIVNAITGEPVRKAQVTLRNEPADSSVSAATDDSGAYALSDVEPGTYDLRVQKNGFVPAGKPVSLQGSGSGWACPGAGGSPVASDAVTRLMPAAVMAGRVVDGDGGPVAGALVQAIQSRGAGSTQRLVVAGSATTNDLGEYRIFGLAGGRYYLGASYRIDAGYAAVYYPGNEDATRALAIDVRAGSESTALNLTMPPVRSLRLRGTVHGPAGLPVEGLMIVAAPCDAGPLNRSTTTVKGRDGVFSLRDLTPGCYVLTADTFNGGKRYSGRLPVTINDEKPEDVRLNLAPPVQLTGRISRDEAGDLEIRKVAVNLEARASKLTAGGAPNDEGIFALNNVVPDIYDLSVILPDGYYLKSAKLGETDVLGAGLDLTRGATPPLELEVSGAGGTVEGSVVDGGSLPLAGVRVALVPADPHEGAARTRSAMADEQGRFQIRGIAPGDYKVYSAPNLDVAALQDPAYSRQIPGQAVTVRSREQASVTVRAAR